MIGFTIALDQNQRQFLEDYRQQQGLYSLADAARELIYLGQLSVAANS